MSGKSNERPFPAFAGLFAKNQLDKATLSIFTFPQALWPTLLGNTILTIFENVISMTFSNHSQSLGHKITFYIQNSIWGENEIKTIFLFIQSVGIVKHQRLKGPSHWKDLPYTYTYIIQPSKTPKGAPHTYQIISNWKQKSYQGDLLSNYRFNWTWSDFICRQ